MSADLGMLAAILSVAVLLFVTEWVRVDVVAILVLVFLALTGLVGPEEALAGFSNSAVVTVWAVFILSGGLMRTGVANLLGQWVLRLAGDGETRLLVLIMIVAAVLSAFMNNVGVAALLLPVVMDIARRTGRSPGRLLMPLAYACLMGGSLTLIGTPPNLLVNEALLQAGLPGFRLFDFTLPGLAINAAGITAVVVLRRFLLPARDGAGTAATSTDLGHFYGLEERLQRVRVPADSPLAGKTIAESQIGTALELTVIGIWRNGRNMLAPHIDTVIVAGDELLVSGPRRHLRAFVAPDYLAVLAEPVVETTLAQLADRVVVARVEEGSRLVGQTVPAAGFRDRLGLNVLALWRHGERVTARLVDSPLRAGDRLVLHGEPDRIAAAAGAGLAVEGSGADVAYRLESHLIQASVPADSPLVGQTLAESRFGDAFDLTVLALDRDGEITLDPGSTLPLAAGDRLIIQGEPAALSSLEAMRSLSPLPSAGFALPTIQSDAVGLMEVMLSPHSQLGGQTLRELSFRAKYDLSVLAIWRAGRAYQENLPDMPLRFGDALLVFGQREKLLILGREPDFLVLTEDATEPPRSERAPIAAIIMAITVLAVLLGVAPLSIAALAASAAMVRPGVSRWRRHIASSTGKRCF